MPFRKKSKSKSKSKCKTYLKNKIRTNLDEYKSGRYVSTKQAIAVSYSQVLKSHPHCKRILKRTSSRSKRRKTRSRSKRRKTRSKRRK